MEVLEVGLRIAPAHWCSVYIAYIILFAFEDWIMEEFFL